MHRWRNNVGTNLCVTVLVLGAALAGLGCTDMPDSPIPADDPVVVADGFDRPTQFTDGPAGILLVAQLAGEENAGTGQIVALDLESGERRTLLTGLDKPTGVLWRQGELWVMVRRGLVRADWAGGDAEAGPVEVVLEDLPYNGRSEGTLTALPDGRLLYATSGSLAQDGEIVEGSGTLWAFDPADRSSVPVAIAVKNAYAHAVLTGGRIATVDIGDNISDPPLDELDIVTLDGGPADLGWPDCPGDRACDGIVSPLALFPVAATPSGVAVIGDDVYVTLFVTGELMRVSIEGWAVGKDPVAPTVVSSNLQGPHTVLARSDGTLWVSEHLTGRIVAVRP